jgi:hypothetical protein
MKNFVYMSALFLFVICACSQEEKANRTSHYVYLLDPGDIKMMDDKGADFFSEINIIPLKEADDFLIGQACKLIKCDSFFYVLDKDKTHSIYKYDLEGNPVKRFFKKGESGDEYIEIIDFDIDQSSKEILVLCVMPKILYLDTDFNSLGKNNNLGYNYFDRIVSWKNKVFLYNHHDKKVAGLNPETGEPEECLRTRKLNDLINPGFFAFYKTPDNLYFQSQGDDCIYKLQGNKFTPFLTLDYKTKESSIKFFEERSLSDRITLEDMMQYSLPDVYNIREKDSKFIFTYVHDIVYRICIYDTVKRTYKDQMKYMYISEHDGGCYDNALYGLENPADHNGMGSFEMPEYHEYMKGVKYDFTGKLDFDEEFENPVVIEQILK